jgi:hypothetical protein
MVFPEMRLGVPPASISGDIVLGCDVPFSPNQISYRDFDVSNSAGFTALASALTNGIDDTLWACSVASDADGSITAPSGCSGGPESTTIDGSNRGVDLNGSTVGFVRLLVNKVVVGSRDVGFGNTENFAGWDVVWQFWSGVPLVSGGGQRSDVDDFLMYANPLQNDITLPAGSTSFTVTVFYGATITLARSARCSMVKFSADSNLCLALARV